MLELHKLDSFIDETLKQDVFTEKCLELTGTKLHHYVQIDIQQVNELKKHYLYISNFESFTDHENGGDELFKSFIDFVIPINPPVEAEGTTKQTEKEILEKIAKTALSTIKEELKVYGIENESGKTLKNLRVLNHTINISETHGATEKKLVMPITFGIINKPLGGKC